MKLISFSSILTLYVCMAPGCEAMNLPGGFNEGDTVYSLIQANNRRIIKFGDPGKVVARNDIREGYVAVAFGDYQVKMKPSQITRKRELVQKEMPGGYKVGQEVYSLVAGPHPRSGCRSTHRHVKFGAKGIVCWSDREDVVRVRFRIGEKNVIKNAHPDQITANPNVKEEEVSLPGGFKIGQRGYTPRVNNDPNPPRQGTVVGPGDKEGTILVYFDGGTVEKAMLPRRLFPFWSAEKIDEARKHIAGIEESLKATTMENTNLKKALALADRENKNLKKQLDCFADFVKKASEAFKGPITFDLIKDPVVTCDGQVYEREAIGEWLERNDTSPKTNLVLNTKDLINCPLLKEISGYLQKLPNPEEHKE